MNSLKALYLDLDCGEGKASTGSGYATQLDALEALRDFCEKCGLPRPLIVDSGGGIHAYWPFEDAGVCRGVEAGGGASEGAVQCMWAEGGPECHGGRRADSTPRRHAQQEVRPSASCQASVRQGAVGIRISA